jgi:TonB family protein
MKNVLFYFFLFISFPLILQAQEKKTKLKYSFHLESTDSFDDLDELPFIEGCDLGKRARKRQGLKKKPKSGTVQKKQYCFKEHLIGQIVRNFRYPSEAFNKGITGKVVIRFIVNGEGDILEESIAETSGHDSLDQEALRIVRSFVGYDRGAMIDGELITAEFSLPIVFKLK